MFKLIDTEKEEYKRVSLGDVVGDNSYAYVSERDDRKPWVYIYDDNLRDKVVKLKISEIQNEFDSLSYEVDINQFYSSTLEINSPERFNKENKIRVELYVETEDWKEKFSLKEFSDALEDISSNSESDLVKYFRDDDEFITNGFGFECDIADSSASLESFSLEFLSCVSELIDKAKDTLSNSNDKIMLELNFPDEIRAPCEQYLMYFSQYLLDLGISSHSEITHNEKMTIFSVIPDCKEQALEVIADSLASYLSLPDELDKYTQSLQNKDVALMQLESNVLHLKSQLMLAQSILESKNATIQSLTLTNDQYKNLIPIEKTVYADDSKEVAVIGEVVKVKEYQGRFVSVDLPRIINNLKRLIRK